LHVGDLDGASAPAGARWNATVVITVHDELHNPVAGVTVTGVWSNGATGSSSCVTDANGQCTVIKINLRTTINTVTFTITNATKAGFTYTSASNHDPDGDSTGTVIVIAKP
ncbi:MAG: Ig-like domain-containing protein, partial [Anaerolineales bacterium]|nr:Ig-like domain-containing protein [Anaerolineales bacterium]